MKPRKRVDKCSGKGQEVRTKKKGEMSACKEEVFKTGSQDYKKGKGGWKRPRSHAEKKPAGQTKMVRGQHRKR